MVYPLSNNLKHSPTYSYAVFQLAKGKRLIGAKWDRREFDSEYYRIFPGKVIEIEWCQTHSPTGELRDKPVRVKCDFKVLECETERVIYTDQLTRVITVEPIISTLKEV